MINNKITIRPYNSDDSISTITEMLHASYKSLADQGLRYWASYQTDEDTRERLEKGDSFILLYDDRIIGTISLVPPVKDTECEFLNRSDVSVFTQFAISPEFHAKGLGTMLLNYVEDYAFRMGFKYIACDTAENAHHLRNYYQKRGYNFVGSVKWGHTNYQSVVLSKELHA